MKTVVRDIAALLGVALISVGSGLVYLPAGLIIGGLFLLGGAVLHGLTAR